MANARTVSISAILIVAAIVIIGGGSWYAYNMQNFVTSGDASVQGTIVPLTAPADGVLTHWRAPLGSTISKGTLLGKVDGLLGQVDFSAPISGAILQNTAVDQEVVVPGEPLGYMVDLNNLQIVANIQENEINNVAVGKTVDITIDAFPNSSFSGTVTQIGSASSVIANGIPNTNLNTNFNKVVQRVPIYISIQATEGKSLLPGMSAEVSIHRN